MANYGLDVGCLNTPRVYVDLRYVASYLILNKTSDEWHHIKYMIFDTPGWQTERVEERWARLERVFPVAESDQWRSLKVCGGMTKYRLAHTLSNTQDAHV